VYRLNLDPVAEEQINAVPEGALRPLAGLFTLLETAPWSGQPFNPPERTEATEQVTGRPWTDLDLLGLTDQILPKIS
jgi:hypothetical protein